MADLGGYRALEPGKADDSELILRIESDDPDDVMPPPDSGHELTEKDRKTLRQWVHLRELQLYLRKLVFSSNNQALETPQ